MAFFKRSEGAFPPQSLSYSVFPNKRSDQGIAPPKQAPTDPYTPVASDRYKPQPKTEVFSFDDTSTQRKPQPKSEVFAFEETPAPKKDTESKGSPLDELRKLKELLDIGALTQEEYDEKKKDLLNRL